MALKEELLLSSARNLVQGTRQCPKSAMLSYRCETSRWRHCPRVMLKHPGACDVLLIISIFIIQRLSKNPIFHCLQYLPWPGKISGAPKKTSRFTARIQGKLGFQSAKDLISAEASIAIHVTNAEPGLWVLS